MQNLNRIINFFKETRMQRLNKEIKQLSDIKFYWSPNTKLFGIKKDKQDKRDFVVGEPTFTLPNSWSLKQYCPPIKNQGGIGSCASNAYCTALEILHNINNDPVELSELFHYYYTRILEGTFPKDSGQQLRNGAKALTKHGVCFESQMLYDTSKFNVEPSWLARITARWLRTKKYYRCSSIEEMKKSIFLNYPVVLGIKVDYRFLTSKDNQIDKLYGKIIGGHAVVINAFKNNNFEITNSWGMGWGNNGYCWLSKSFIEKNLIDAWCLTK